MDLLSRKRLFNKINELPTIFEVVTGTAEKQTKKKSSISNHSSNKKSSSKGRASEPAKDTKAILTNEEVEGLEEEEDEEPGDTLCGSCRENFTSNEFWICGDGCKKWFHGKCVKITPARAEHIKQYKCPSCSSNKRARPSYL